MIDAAEPVRAPGLLDVGGLPGMFNWRALEADALIGLDRLDEAKIALDEFEAAIPPGRAGIGGACPCSLSGKSGRGDRRCDPGGARCSSGRTRWNRRCRCHSNSPWSRLDDGRRLRWIEDVPGAVAELERAHEIFSDLGADPYVAACAAELAALQVSAATESPAALLGLSRAELAVARLVATGLTNREAAAELFVSVKTVEYHLRNCFIKLDIRSRRELTELLR